MLVSIICFDCRWSCCCGDPAGGTCPSEGATRRSDAAALKAVEELRAEQAAHRRSEEKVAEMAIELKNAADRYELLKKEHENKSADLSKALNATKEIRTKLRRAREELQQTGKIALEAPI